MNKIYNAHEEKVNKFAEALRETDVSIKEIAEVLKGSFSEEELNILKSNL